MYILADWNASDEGFRPNLPENCGFQWLAGEAEVLGFGLFDVSGTDLLEPIRDSLLSRQVAPALAVLLDSCRVFPPALAGAVQELHLLGVMTRTRFVKELERLLSIRLEAQREKPFLLARSRISETGYRNEGEFVWVVNYNPDRVGKEVTWVASDFQVYVDAIGTFDLDATWLKSRFNLG
jgi:hypothetical protein